MKDLLVAGAKAEAVLAVAARARMADVMNFILMVVFEKRKIECLAIDIVRK